MSTRASLGCRVKKPGETTIAAASTTQPAISIHQMGTAVPLAFSPPSRNEYTMSAVAATYRAMSTTSIAHPFSVLAVRSTVMTFTSTLPARPPGRLIWR